MSLSRTLGFIINHPLNRNKKTKSIINFVRWQIGSRVLCQPVVHKWVNGSRLLVKAGETGLTSNIYTGLQEFSEMGFLLHVLRKEDLFIDVGANAGSYTVLACSAVGASGVSFEPIPDAFRRLEDNIYLNRLFEKVEIRNVGLGERRGFVFFTSDGDTTNHALTNNVKEEHAVRVYVDTLDNSIRGRHPSVMKIDVEGYEMPVLKGAQETLKDQSLHSVILEVNGCGNRYGYDESDIFSLMRDYGFKGYSYDPIKRLLMNYIEGRHDDGNVIFIRNKSLVEHRIREASAIHFYGSVF